MHDVSASVINPHHEMEGFRVLVDQGASAFSDGKDGIHLGIFAKYQEEARWEFNHTREGAHGRAKGVGAREEDPARNRHDYLEGHGVFRGFHVLGEAIPGLNRSQKDIQGELCEVSNGAFERLATGLGEARGEREYNDKSNDCDTG